MDQLYGRCQAAPEGTCIHRQQGKRQCVSKQN